VAADANPYTGVDVYDSTPSPEGYPTGWSIWGGTSVASPIIAAEFGLAGGAHGVEFPAATLYAHLGESSALYDVVSGSNGSCTEATSCRAVVGYDGPTGVGSPTGLAAFATAASPANLSLPTISGTVEEGQALTVTNGEWSSKPTAYGERWLLCDASGSSCTAIAGATGATLTLPASAVGDTIRVQEIASNASGSGSPAISRQTARVISDVPAITGFTPSSGITGSSVTITGTAFTAATGVRFDGLTATFAVESSTQIEAIVPNAAHAGALTVTAKAGTGTSKADFTPTLSLVSLTPAKAAPGATVTITGVGFNSGSKVGFDGIAASVAYVSSTKLKATVPAEARTGAIKVTNTSAPVGAVSSASSFTVT
jgi:hypothetical protein